jgi:hypothetical protein
MKKLLLTAFTLSSSFYFAFADDRPMTPVKTDIPVFVSGGVSKSTAPDGRDVTIPVLQSAKLALLTTGNREIVLSLGMPPRMTIPIPLDLGVKLAEALEKGAAACDGITTDFLPIDNFNWEAAPVPSFGREGPSQMNINIIVSKRNSEEKCVLMFRTATGLPSAPQFYLPPEAATELINQLPNVDDAATKAGLKPIIEFPDQFIERSNKP